MQSQKKRTYGLGVCSWERAAFGQASQSCLNFVALQDMLMDMCFHQEVVNMPGIKTDQARSLFGQHQVRISTRPLWDNVFAESSHWAVGSEQAYQILKLCLLVY